MVTNGFIQCRTGQSLILREQHLITCHGMRIDMMYNNQGQAVTMKCGGMFPHLVPENPTLMAYIPH